MNVRVQSLKAISVASDILVLGFFEENAPPRGLAGEVDWALNNSLSLLIKSGKISGHFGEVVLVSSEKTRTSKILWVGLGKKEGFNHILLLKLASDVYQRLVMLGVKEAYLDLWDIEGSHLDFSSALNACLNGICQSQKEMSASRFIDLTFHSREKDRVREMNRFLKDFDFKSKASFAVGGELFSQRK